MARSTKKPYYKDHTPGAKAVANRRVRRKGKVKMEDTPSGASYKQHFQSWDISDWCFHAPKDKKAYRK